MPRDSKSLEAIAMGVMRSVLLAGSESRWLRRQAPKLGFVRKAVSRFMPGEHLDDALTAARAVAPLGLGAIVTKLGESVTEPAEAEAVAAHYADALERLKREQLDCIVSVKPTQLGIDIDRARCFEHLRRLAGASAEQGRAFYIDMEQRQYTDVTLELYHRLLAEHRGVGVCLQAYLYRTEQDLRAIIAAGGAVRLVKGAYQEPASVAWPKKRDVDRNFLALAKVMIGPDARANGCQAVFGTHDTRLIDAISLHADQTGVPRDGYEFALLYGIQRAAQVRLARERHRVRVLISYGDSWFPWYMRRLAERPANVWFVARSMLSR
jgi:proline dehydrogenase